jgi:hypothetical protein
MPVDSPAQLRDRAHTLSGLLDEVLGDEEREAS